MKNNEFQDKLEKFDTLAKSTQERLTGIISLLESCKIPSRDAIETLDADFEALRVNYEDAVALAKDQLFAEELPLEGSGLREYAAAVKNSSVLRIKQQIEKAEKILSRFTRIRAKLSEYEQALKPYQDAAQDLLKELSEETIDEVTVATKAPEVLLDAIDIEDIHSSEGFALLGEVSKYYPTQVQWGISGRLYYIDNPNTEEQVHLFEEATREELTLSDDVSDCDDVDESKETQEELEESHDINIINEAIVAEENNEDALTVDQISGADIVESYENPAGDNNIENGTVDSDILSPINRPKNGSGSASSFRKEIVKIGKIKPEIRIVLPLLTNVGAVTKEQAYLFGVCMDCFKETDKSRNAVEISIDTLAQKGYLACYRYEVEGHEEEAFCLSSYCYNCLRKDTVAVLMRDYWGFSFGKHKLIGEEKIQKEHIINTIDKNDELLRYLYSVRVELNESEYAAVIRSICFKDNHYHVAVIYQGMEQNCILLSNIAEIIDIEEKEILLFSENDSIPSEVNINTNTVFLFYQGTIVRYNYTEGKLQVAENNSEEESDIKEEEKFEDELASDKQQELVDIINEKIESNAINEKEECEAEIKKSITEEVAITEKSVTPSNENIDPSALLKTSETPSDDVLCALISKLLNRQVSTNEQITSVIVQSVILANGAGLANDRPNAQKYAEQLKVATHLILGEMPYSSEHLTAIFANPDEENKTLLLSAYLFAMLNPSVSYDYGLRNQTEMFFSQYERYFEQYSAFKPLFNKLLSVQSIATAGFTPAVISLLGSAAESERFIGGLRKEAKNYLSVQSPKTRMKVLPILYTNCFGLGSDLFECMTIIAEDKEDQDSVEYVETILAEYCNRQNDAFILNSWKIEESLANEWDKIVEKNKFKLEYDAHDQAIRQFTSRLELMLTWYEQMGNLKKREQDISRLRVLKQEILATCTDIQKDGAWKKEPYSNILSWLLISMKDYLNGSYSKQHIFAELLLTGVIPVNEDGAPNIDPTMAGIRYYEPWRNALRHIVAEKRSAEDVKAEILGDNIESDDEEAGLKDNLHQLEMLGKLVESDDDDYVITEAQVKEATDSANERTVRFKETLELAYTYNQINEIEKETLSSIMTRYKKDFYAAMDFATWRRFLEALELQIKEYAAGRKVGLRSRLDRRLVNDPNAPILLEADKLLENDMNFAVTEEYLNRYEAGETDFDVDSDSILHDKNYFDDFLKGENFEEILRECRRNDGRMLKSFAWAYLEKRLPHDWTSRLRDDSKTLINCWPSKRDTTNAEQIKTLFTCLGLNVIHAVKVNTRKEQTFQIDVKPTPKSMSDYRHPIAAFGTQLKSPMNVIVLYGNYTEKQLVDTITSLDLGGISIVLIDRAFDVARRRLIGEIFHTQTSGQNPFLLIDQVLFMYLAMHQVTERLPALLKCTLPYTTYQPFVRDGGSTTDEMFCGRMQELSTIIDPNGACVVYGGRQLGKTALLERVESRCSKPENKRFAIYSSIVRIKNEEEVVNTLVSDIDRKTGGKINLRGCSTIKEMCGKLSNMFRNGRIVSMHLLIDEVDDFLAAIADQAYKQLQPLVDLRRETTNNFKFVIAGLHNVCRAKNATKENGIFGQLGTPLCIKPLSPTDALKLLSRPLNYLGFQIERYPHLETILTNTNYYPGILQFFGYMLVQTLNNQYSKYYRAADGNPPFTLQDEQLGAVMNSSDLNKSIKEKFRLSLELDPRYFMIARCITMLYYYYEDDRSSGSWLGFEVEEIKDMASSYKIHCLENETADDYKNLLDEMEEMGILSQPSPEVYRLRRSSFVDIIGENIDVLEQDIINNNKEA